MADIKGVEADQPEVVHTTSHDENASNTKSYGADASEVVMDPEKQASSISPVNGAGAPRTRQRQPPAFLVNMSAEERAAMEKRLKRKIDFRLLPMIILMYILNYIDRNNISAATLGGLKTDLNLTSQQFSVSRPGREKHDIPIICGTLTDKTNLCFFFFVCPLSRRPSVFFLLGMSSSIRLFFTTFFADTLSHFPQLYSNADSVKPFP